MPDRNNIKKIVIMKTYHWTILLLAAALIAVSYRLAINSNSEPAVDTDSSDNGNAAIECIMTRASVRQYADKEISDSVTEKILRAGMAAPTARNSQPWEFIVVTEQSIRDSLNAALPYAKMLESAKLAIVVCGNMDKTLEGDARDNWILDCSAASENMLLAAHALGVGGVWCGVYPSKERSEGVTRALNLPANLIPLNVLSFGYPDKKPAVKDKWDTTKIHYNNF